ncbi:MAG: YraN family protein [Treponema sp.]|nr:YraN family protein [Treponema sp.]
MNSSRLGREGEDRAVELLRESGLSIVERNFRWRSGEVDIIAMDGETLVFVEVKSWSTMGIENLAYGVDAEKQARIIETANYFLSLNRQYEHRAIRFDVIFVAKRAVTHLASAFMETV